MNHVWARGNVSPSARIGSMARFYGDPLKLTIDEETLVDDFVYLYCCADVVIGKNVHIGANVTIIAYNPVTICDGVTIMPGSKLITRIPYAGRNNGFDKGPITIGSFSVIGAGAYVGPNVILPECTDLAPNGVEQ